VEILLLSKIQTKYLNFSAPTVSIAMTTSWLNNSKLANPSKSNVNKPVDLKNPSKSSEQIPIPQIPLYVKLLFIAM